MSFAKRRIALTLACVLLFGTISGIFGTASSAAAQENYWSNASGWAKEELLKASELQLVPERLKNADMTQSITRIEFAAVAVKVYEALGKTPALPAVVNPFTDTADMEVLKAYNLGVVNGTSATTFSPNAPLNREQAATMLTRVYKRINLPGWTLQTDSQHALSYTMPAKFLDDAGTSGWAKDSVYFMVANGIINGVGSNQFAPGDTATREQALAIAVRMVENLTGTKAEPSALDQQVQTASAAYEATLSRLLDGSTEVEISVVMQALYADAVSLEQAGIIKDLRFTEDALLYEYTDGLPGGVILDLSAFSGSEEVVGSVAQNVPRATATPPIAAAASLPGIGAAQLSGTALPTSQMNLLALNTADTTTNSAENNVSLVGSNKVLFGMSTPIIEDSYGTAELQKLSHAELAAAVRSSGKDLEVTQIDTMTVADFRNLNQYGAIFLNLPCAVPNNGDPIVFLDERFDCEKLFDEYYNEYRNRFLGAYSFISPKDPVAALRTDSVLTMSRYGYKLVFGLFIDQYLYFRHINKDRLFPNSFIHLGYAFGMDNTHVSQALLDAGALCVTGYEGRSFRLDQDYNVSKYLVENLLKDDGSGHRGRTISQIESQFVVASGMTRVTQKHRYYENSKNWRIVEEYVTAQAVMRRPKAPEGQPKPNLRLWEEEAKPVVATGPLVITQGTFEEVTDSFSVQRGYAYHVTWTVQNNGSVPVNGLTWENVINGEKNRLPVMLQFQSIEAGKSKPPINPGETFTYEATLTFGREDKIENYDIILISYYTGSLWDGKWNDIPEADRVVFSLSGK